MGGVIYGLVKTPEYKAINRNKICFTELRYHLRTKFKTSQWWPLYFLQYKNIEHNSEFWIDVQNGNFKLFMKDFIMSVLQAPEDLKKDL